MTGVTDRGRVAVGAGTIEDGQVMAMRWTPSAGVERLGRVPGALNSVGVGVSARGDVVGYSIISSSPLNWRAVHWSPAGTLTDLGALMGGSYSAGRGLSADGSVVVGESGVSSSRHHPFRWTAGTGMQSLGLPPGSSNASADGVSSGGNIVGGTASIGTSIRWFRWASSAGYELLPVPSGANTWCNAISADGETVVGRYVTSSTRTLGCVWSSAGGLRSLQGLHAAQGTWPTAVSSDGALIVGRATYQPGTPSGTLSGAVYWDATGTTHHLLTRLQAMGCDTTGWTGLLSIDSISPDGRTFGGQGKYQGKFLGFVLTVPVQKQLGILAIE